MAKHPAPPRSPWDRLSPTTPSGHVNVVVETPRGSQHKYKYDEALGLFRLNRVLFAGAAFPFDFGFVPGTRGGDGDPLDAIVLTDQPTFAGCLVRVRPLGVLLASKEGRDNHRVITVPVLAKPYATWRDVGDLPVGRLAEVEQFFRAVLNVDGYEHALHGFAGRARADTILARAARRAGQPLRQASTKPAAKATRKKNLALSRLAVSFGPWFGA